MIFRRLLPGKALFFLGCLSCNVMLQAQTPDTIEAENISYVPEGATRSEVSDPGAGGGTWIKLAATGTGQTLTFFLPNAAAGNYEIGLKFVAGEDRGRISLHLDGRQVGGVIDEYAAASAFSQAAFGTVSFTTTGSHVLQLKTEEKNASSNGYVLSVDLFTFTMAGASPPVPGPAIQPTGTPATQTPPDKSAASESVSMPVKAMTANDGKTPGTMRIMPMGDSLTYGHTIPGGYRRYLYDSLTNAGVPFDFVGQLEYQPNDPTPDKDFFAAGGTTISLPGDLVNGKSYVLLSPYKKGFLGLLARLPQAITTANFSTSPSDRNVILLMIGINDVLKKICGTHYGAVENGGQPEDKLGESAFERLLAFLDAINSLAAGQNLHIEVLVGTETEIGNSQGPGSATQQAEMHDYNQQILTSLPKSYSNITVKGVDAQASFAHDLLDRLHPNPAGFKKLGDFWAGVIRQ